MWEKSKQISQISEKMCGAISKTIPFFTVTDEKKKDSFDVHNKSIARANHLPIGRTSADVRFRFRI